MTRAIRTIVVSSLIFLVLVNLVAFTITKDFSSGDWHIIHTDINGGSEFKFRGFKYFMEYISTFPGLANSGNLLNLGLNLLSGQANLTKVGWADAIIGVFYLLVSPITLIVGFILDIINNAIWVFGFFVPNWL